MAGKQEYQNFFYHAQDGLKLHARIYGDAVEGANPVICLAGLTRNAHDFHDLAIFLSRHPKTPRQVIAFDYRGRGRSAYDPNSKNYDPVIEAGDILSGMAATGIEHAAFIGTSRGGLIMHVLAAMRPGVMRAGILNDIGPVVEGEGLTMIRTWLERAPNPTSWEDAMSIVTMAMKDAFPALEANDYERSAQALYRDENGKPVADYDPALLKTLTSLDLSKPLPTFWPQFVGLTAIPLMTIRGANSRLFSAATLEEMIGYAPSMEAITVEGQGHAPLLETGELPERIAGFLARVDQGKAKPANEPSD